ncbi:MAG: hypothetical protein WKF37_23995 [Bryobacteraceae bacterium]
MTLQETLLASALTVVKPFSALGYRPPAEFDALEQREKYRHEFSRHGKICHSESGGATAKSRGSGCLPLLSSVTC